MNAWNRVALAAFTLALSIASASVHAQARDDSKSAATARPAAAALGRPVATLAEMSQ